MEEAGQRARSWLLLLGHRPQKRSLNDGDRVGAYWIDAKLIGSSFSREGNIRDLADEQRALFQLHLVQEDEKESPNGEIEPPLACYRTDDTALGHRMRSAPAGVHMGAGRNHILRPVVARDASRPRGMGTAERQRSRSVLELAEAPPVATRETHQEATGRRAG